MPAGKKQGRKAEARRRQPQRAAGRPAAVMKKGKSYRALGAATGIRCGGKHQPVAEFSTLLLHYFSSYGILA